MNHNKIDCIHLSVCSGCVCTSVPELYQEAKKFFQDHFHLELPLKQGPFSGFRSRAKLAVRAPNLIGLFEKGSHRILPIPHCQVHHPKINEAVRRLQKANLSCYNEVTHKGDLRYIQCVVERKTGKVQLSLVLNRATKSEAWQQFAEELYAESGWHSIWFNYNDRPTNTIFSPHWEKAVGLDCIWEQIAGLDIAFGPSHFGQANLEMYEELVLDIQRMLPTGAKVCELYAGIGVIGLALAQSAQEVHLSDIESHSKTYFELAKSKLPQEQQQKLFYHVGPAQTCLHLLEGKDCCIVDPPRKGLGPKLLKQLLATPNVKRLFYVSCDFRSLERDLLFLQKEIPGWTVTSATSYLFFPGTNQIETLAVLQNSGNC